MIKTTTRNLNYFGSHLFGEYRVDFRRSHSIGNYRLGFLRYYSLAFFANILVQDSKRSFSSSSPFFGYHKEIITELMLKEIEDWEEGDDIGHDPSPKGANSAIFSVGGFSAELLYYCVFRYLKSNCTYAIIVCVRSDKQEYYHGTGVTIRINVLDSNSIKECGVLYKNIQSNIHDFITSEEVSNSVACWGDLLDETEFVFNPIEDKIEYIHLTYLELSNTSSTNDASFNNKTSFRNNINYTNNTSFTNNTSSTNNISSTNITSSTKSSHLPYSHTAYCLSPVTFSGGFYTPLLNKHSLNSRAFSSSSLTLGLRKEWEDHVINLLEYGDQYIDPEHLVELGRRIYKDGDYVNLKEMREDYSLAGIYIGEDKLEDLIYDCPSCRGQQNKNNLQWQNKFYGKDRSSTSLNSKRFYSTSERKRNDFLNIISIPAKTKSKTKKVWVDFSVFSENDLTNFIHDIYYSNKLLPGIDYSIIFKSKKNDIYLTFAEKQVHFNFNSKDDHYSFDKLFYFIVDKLADLFEEYESIFNYCCDSILLEFRQVSIEEKLKISQLDVVKREHPKINLIYTAKDLAIYGKTFRYVNGSPLNANIVNGKLNISNTFDIENLDRFLEEYNKKMNIDKVKDYLVNDSTKFYLVYRMNRPFIITLNTSDDGNIVYKICFNIYGDLVSKVKDMLNKDGTFTRESRNSATVYKDDTIISVIRNINFTPIRKQDKSTINKKTWLPNSNIGTLDLETYECDGVAKCYALGFYCNEFGQCKTYYIDKDLNSTILIHTCIDEMLKPKYNKNIFYVHNLGKFDAPFIIRALIDFNKTKQGKNNPYILDISTRNNDILKLIIKRKVNDRVQTVKLQDSVAILPRDLRSLCKDFQVETEKGFFPYNFCTKDTLFYVGKTPSINYYNNIPAKAEYYNSLFKEVWSLQEQCILYLEKDLISLCQVLVKVNRTFHLLFKIQMTDFLTISGISQQIFLKDHYDDNKKPIPLVNNRIVWDDIYQAYYGGRVEVHNPFFITNKTKSRKLYYYDVNSLYPFASLNPMPGTECQYIESFGQFLDLEKLFGFFYCKVKSPACADTGKILGLLPKRTEKGNLTFPVGEWYGWYFSEELLFAKANGYTIEVIKGYNFDSNIDVFTSFVSKVMGIKINANNPTERNVAKLILNSLIGRFGMDFLKSVTKLVDGKTHDIVSVTRALKSSIEMDDDLFLDTFKLGIDKKVCETFGVDYIKALNIESIDEKSTTRTYRTVSIPIATATLSYARIHMAKLMMHILDKGGKIYYTDTDSIVTDFKLSDDFLDQSELGKLKIENEIIEGYFIADKTYAFINASGKLVKKAKGVDSEHLTLDDYKSMFKKESIKNAVKTTSNRDYKKGSVVITTKHNIKLNSEYYAKREKIFENGIWVGTKAINIKEV